MCVVDRSGIGKALCCQCRGTASRRVKQLSTASVVVVKARTMLACPRPLHTPAPPLQVQAACMLGNLISRHKHCTLGTQADSAVGTCMPWRS